MAQYSDASNPTKLQSTPLVSIISTDYLIIGAGIIGLSIARALFERDAGASIRILEKEDVTGRHASGRNSGVLHAGFYYSRDSLKAHFTREGNRRMRSYCLERGLAINECGKLVAATRENEIAGLDELLRRATQNGIEASLISESEARELEPRIRTLEKALWSPSTASVDPRAILDSLERELQTAGVRIDKGVRYISGGTEKVRTSRGLYSTAHLINAAGLYADRIAHGMGFGRQYRVMPFKGLYLRANPKIGLFQRHIYPVPNLNNPFLGVHWTLTSDRRIKIGPTAIPGLWREHYGGLKGFDSRDVIEALFNNATLYRRDPRGYRTLAGQEIRKILKRNLVREAARMASKVDESMFSDWGAPGIRAQLLDVAQGTLVLDFVVEGDLKSTHVLNAVSPAFTCALPFADFVVDRILKQRSSDTSRLQGQHGCSSSSHAVD